MIEDILFLFFPRTLVRTRFGVSRHFSLPGLRALIPGRDEDVYVLGPLEGFEGEEDDFYFGCLVFGRMGRCVSRWFCFFLYVGWHWLTFARCVYSASRGWPDCSRLSRIKVKGEDASLWLSSLEIKRMLCVRRCWIVDGAMFGRVLFERWTLCVFPSRAEQARLMVKTPFLCQ